MGKGLINPALKLSASHPPWPASRGWRGSPFSGQNKKRKSPATRGATPLNLGAWNVRTLLDRKGTDRPERRMALVDRELDRYQVDMAALSETRLADVGEAAEAHYTFFWSGKASNLKREAGVGFAIKTSAKTLGLARVSQRLSTTA